MVGISIQIPNASATSVDHTVGNLDIRMLMDYGRILYPINWGGLQTVQDATTLGFIGLVIDHDNYDHAPGAVDIADCYNTTSPYLNDDDFKSVKDITMVIDDGTTQKSFASFQNKATDYPDDILINQTCWTVKNKDWAILQWTLTNVKSPASDLTNVRIGLEVPISKEGSRYGLGGNLIDSGDDIDGYDSTNDVYWAQDTGDSTTIGFASAVVPDPITHYHAEDYHADYSSEYVNFFGNDAWLYQRLQAPNAIATDGVTPGNITATVGWDGFDILAGEFRTFALVMAINNSFADMMAALKDAQNYYFYEGPGFRITEFSDSNSGTQQIEVFNYEHEPTNLIAEGYFLSVDGGINSLTGTWNNNPLPTYEHAVFTLDPGETIGPEGDTIGLYQNIGGNKVLTDEVSFGQEGVAPDPLSGESVARRFDATGAVYTHEWLRNASTGPTWGAQNDVGSLASFPQVVLNRVMFNPIKTSEMYVELMWKKFSMLDISGYRIVCDDEFIVPQGTILGPPNIFFVLKWSDSTTFFTNMNAMGDNVYLYDNNGNLLDMVGWSSPHNQGEFMSRIPDGIGTYQGYDDVTSQAAGWIFDNLPSLIITEFYADSGSATIELYNQRGGDKVLDTRWSFTVDSGTLTGTYATNPILSGGYTLFTMTGGSPGNEGDTIRFYYTGSVTEEVSFGINGVAPDPLVGESTARYWDTTDGKYSNDWTREVIPTFGTQNDVPMINSNPFVVLNEVMFNPSIIPDGKYIVIINNWGATIDVSNYYLVCDDHYQLTPMVIPSFTTHMINYTTAPSLFNSMNPNGDNVYLYDSNGQLLDMIGWNTPHNQGMSVRRVPDGAGTYQGHDNTTSEAAGWIFNSPLQVLMTEISDDGSTQAQIEVYNPRYSIIDFNMGFTFESDSTPPGPLSGAWWIKTANSGEHAVFNVNAGLDPEGDTISLYQNGELIEEISYGQKGLVPDPLKDESVQRYWDGSAYTNEWERNWTSGPTFGGENDVPPANFSSLVVLNEIMFNPSVSENGFVELYLKSDTPIDISGYKIVGDSEYIIPDGTELTSDYRFFYLTQPTGTTFFAALNSLGDNVYLYDANGSLLDMVGWSSPHTQNLTMTRMPEGNGTYDGFNDLSSEAAGWKFNQPPTLAILEIGPDQSKYSEPGEHVFYNLTVTNKQFVADYIDITNSTADLGWQVTFFDSSGVNLLTDTNGNGIPDIGLLGPAASVDIKVRVTIPSILPSFAETIVVYGRVSTYPLGGDSAILTTKVSPYLEPKKVAGPTTIYVESAGVLGVNNITTITLEVFGAGTVIPGGISPADVLFIIDDTGSMSNEIDAVKIHVNNITDRLIENVTDIRFGLVTYKDSPEMDLDLTYDVMAFRDAVRKLDASGGGDYPEDVEEALQLGRSAHWRIGNDVIKIMILIGDAPPHNIMLACQIAATAFVVDGIITNAIATDNRTDMPEAFLWIAENGSGIFRYIPNGNPADPNEFPSVIINDVLANLPPITVAGYDSNITDDKPMINEVLPNYINYVEGTFKDPITGLPKDPDHTFHNPTNTTLQWEVSQILVNETWSVSFDVTSTKSGWVPVGVYPDAKITYKKWNGSEITYSFPEVFITVLDPYLYPPYINNIQVANGNVNITWDLSPSLGVNQYEVYGGPDQISIDFNPSSLIYATPLEPAPASQWWAEFPFDTNANSEYYFVVRAVNSSVLVTRSSTSNTAGYYKKQFSFGLSTFSLPLEPFANFDIDYYTTNMNADYIKYMDPTTHTWILHNFGDGNKNNTQMKLGEGYVVKFSSQTNYTFIGMPGAMINYDDDSGFLGFDLATEAKNLTVSVKPDGNVTLTWEEPASMGFGDWYEVYYSNTRDGFFGTFNMSYFLVCLPVYFGNNSTTHNGAQANNPGTRLYYMVVPFNASGIRGASTYSIGIWTEEYLQGYDTFGIPLKLETNQTADWYCDNIPDTVGINYYIYSEQRWCWHSTRMPAEAYDPLLVMTEGYQISTSSATKFTFIGR